MTQLDGLLRLGVELMAVLAAGAFTATMWRRRVEPTARPLLVVAGLLLVGALGHPVVVHPNPVRAALADLTAGVGSPLWVILLVVLVLLAGGFWFLFTLRYTGRGGRLIPLAAAAIGGFWLLVLVLAAFGDITPSEEVAAATNAEFALFVGSYLMGVVMVVGSVLVLTTSLRRNAVRVREALALAGGGALLAFAPILANTLPQPTTVPAVIAIASGLFLLSVRRYPLFEAPPVARIAGRDRLIEELDDAYVVVDLDGRVRDLNAAGERYFDTEAEAAFGEPLDALLPGAVDPAELARAEEPATLRTGTGAMLAVTANRVTDARGRSFGHLLVFQDVTERQRRERRLRVLNRLLTGAVSERMRDVAATVEPVSTDTTGRESESEAASASMSASESASGGESAGTEPSSVGGAVRAETARLLDLVAWTRDIERTLAEGTAGPVEVGPVVREVAETVTDDRAEMPAIPEADAVGAAAVDAAVLETTLEILLTDALERAEGTVELTIVEGDGGPEVHIVDDGPAPDAADAVVGTVAGDGSDRSDADRSDVLLEMVQVAARHAGGDVSIRDAGAGRRRTVLELPGVDGPAPGDGDPAAVGATGATGEVEDRGEADP